MGRTQKYQLRLVTLFFCSLMASLIGCSSGPKLYDVQGVVNVDGQPTEGINLLFFKQGNTSAVASGSSKSGGAIKTITNGEIGIELGKYDVVAIYPDPQYKAPASNFGQTPPDPPDLFKGKYFKNKVPVDISSANNKITIDLTMK